MGYLIVIGGTEVHDLATIYGWKLFKQWADTLPLPAYDRIVHLAAHGWVEPAADLATQLEEATKTDSPLQPTDAGVQIIAVELAQSVRAALKVNPDAQSAFVSDGTTKTKRKPRRGVTSM